MAGQGQPLTLLLAVIAVGLVVGAVVGLRVAERIERRDADLAALLTANQFLTDLEVEAERWGR